MTAAEPRSPEGSRGEELLEAVKRVYRWDNYGAAMRKAANILMVELLDRERIDDDQTRLAYAHMLAGALLVQSVPFEHAMPMAQSFAEGVFRDLRSMPRGGNA